MRRVEKFRSARYLAARAALASSPAGPTTDEAILERPARRFEQRLSGPAAEAEADTGSTPASGAVDLGTLADPEGAWAPWPAKPEAVGAAVLAAPAEAERALTRKQRRAFEPLRRKVEQRW